MDARLREAVEAAIRPLGVRTMDVPSGAGHDTMCVATVAPAAMIFVPSQGGRSHVGEEYTKPEDLELGVEALMQSIVAVDRLLSKGS